MFETLEGLENSKKAIEMAVYMKNKFLFQGVQKPSPDKIIKPYPT